MRRRRRICTVCHWYNAAPGSDRCTICEKSMSYQAFDTAEIITDYAAIRNAGYTSVGVYARDDRCPFAMTQGLIKAGVKIFTIWEEGNPTHDGYFTVDQAKIDANKFLPWAKEHGQPVGTTVSPCADYDCVPKAVMPYMIAYHNEVKPEGYTIEPYGNGDLLAFCVHEGYCEFGGFLAQSTGWGGYQRWAPHAAIRQGPSGTVCGHSVDFDTVVNPKVTWG